ncbi:MAG: M12 family metallo-peptidase [Rudaea sp.]|nr:M12 family metallo-peptidase [Rudaea sp.]
MFPKPALRAISLIVLCALSSTTAASDLALTRTTRAQLAKLQPGGTLTIKAFPAGPGENATLAFHRVDIYSGDAHVYIAGADGSRTELPKSNRIFLRGYSSDGSVRVALSLNQDLSIAEGNGIGARGSFVLRTDATRTSLHAMTLESAIPAGTKLDFQCGNELENMDTSSGSVAQKLGIATAGIPVGSVSSSRFALVAVDTDSLFMSKLFGNNTISATNWIASVFNTMNTMYEADLNMQLLQGTTILRTSSASDPYTGATDVPADGNDLNIFGSYWKTNEAGVPRTFATLLSGRGPCSGNGCSASGIAWINQYCQDGFSSGANTVGSYNVVQVFSSLSIDPNGNIAARLMGHELGHNFGAYHTHCTNAGTGVAPTGTNTIDQCISGEVDGGTACYSGATSCPQDGGVSAAGTIMSYCNIKGCPAPGSQNALQFHPVQITVLGGYINQQSTCLNASDEIFANGFDS